MNRVRAALLFSGSMIAFIAGVWLIYLLSMNGYPIFENGIVVGHYYAKPQMMTMAGIGVLSGLVVIVAGVLWGENPPASTIPFSRPKLLCPSCDHQIEAVWHICPMCGAGLGASASENASQEAAGAPSAALTSAGQGPAPSASPRAFCPHCGAKAEGTPFCPFCGGEIKI